MRTRSFAIAALVTAGALTLNAQTPTPQAPSPNPQTTRPADQQPRPGDTTQRAGAAAGQTITISGCLKAEKDVPGLKPNVAERAGVTEDYILTAVKMSPASATSGIGLAMMYEIEGVGEDELKKHLNHQVELTGRITDAKTTAGSDDVPDFQATSLKMVAATCAAAK
jgi:hypothetical protein